MSRVEKKLEYVCVECGRKGTGRYVAGGWWQFPLGWLLHDDGERWTCSVHCAAAAASPPPTPPA